MQLYCYVEIGAPNAGDRYPFDCQYWEDEYMQRVAICLACVLIFAACGKPAQNNTAASPELTPAAAQTATSGPIEGWGNSCILCIYDASKKLVDTKNVACLSALAEAAKFTSTDRSVVVRVATVGCSGTKP